MPSASASRSSIFLGHGLACRRGDRLIFAGLGFELASGGVLLLTGPNGSGKSSLLRVMAGLTPAVGGRLAWDGVPISDDPGAHRERLHFIGHADALKAAFSVAETLRFWSGLRGGDNAGVETALKRFQLEPLADLPCRFLSAGQRRRLALARLVASPAALWLLDEPTSGLDDQATADLMAAIAAHRARGGLTAMATHAPLPLDGAQRLALGDFAPRRAA